MQMTSKHIERCSASLIIQFSSVAQSCLTPCDPMNRSLPGLPVHHQLLEFTQTLIHRVGGAIQPSHPLSSPSPPSPNPSQHQGLFLLVSSSWGGQSFSFSISPSNEHPGLISFRMDWLDLRAVQGTLKSLLQHHSSKWEGGWINQYGEMKNTNPDYVYSWRLVLVWLQCLDN